MVGVGDCDGEGVGGVGAGDGGAGEEAHHHGVDLRFVGAAGADHRLLDQPRGIFADTEAGAGGGGEDDAAGLAELEGRLRVLVDEHLLDRGGLRMVLGNQGFELARKVGEALGQRGVGLRFELAIGEVGEAVALGTDETPAGGAEPRVEAEDEAQASRSSSSSGTRKLPDTVWTSSSSSSASISFMRVDASSPRTSTWLAGFQASLAESGSPSAVSRARATVCRESTVVQISWPPSSLSTSSAPA